MVSVDNTVRGALSGRTLISVTPKHTIREAAAVLSSHNIGAAPVLSGEQLVGIFTERDILRKVVAAGRHPESVVVADVMTPNPQTISVESPLVYALSIMIERKFRHLPVVDESSRVVGMLSIRDIPLANHIMYQNWTAWKNSGSTTSSSAA